MKSQFCITSHYTNFFIFPQPIIANERKAIRLISYIIFIAKSARAERVVGRVKCENFLFLLSKKALDGEA